MKLVIFDWGSTLYNNETKALFEETKGTLAYLKERGYTLTIVSLATAGQERINERLQIIEQEHLRQYFDNIKFDVANKDAMYEATLRELHARPEDTTIVDDRVLRGIAWGNAHGCTTIWIQKGKFAGELPDENAGTPNHTITSIGELKGIF